MTRGFLLASLVLIGAPLALAEPESCAVPPSGSYEGARLSCDLDRAARIMQRTEILQGPLRPAKLSIVDTMAPSGSAYVYTVYGQNGWSFLEARSVPVSEAARRAPSCRLDTMLPADVSQSLDSLTRQIESDTPAAYGAREEVTHNPDGSRTLRLVLDSHDIVTRIGPAGSGQYFSRHAGSDDPVSRLNQLVIGVANVSSAWSCDGS
ncbi:hypothetical protein [Hyphomonas sp.]|uniref:hypothetical protein n=1 Tax=Hyphomonas sp. TaxID=87 RepID=UPI00391A841D